MIKIIILFLFSTNILAYTPTVESLLRNGYNPDTEDKTVVASFIIRSAGDEEEISNAHKVYLQHESDKRRLMLLKYRKENVAQSELVDIEYFPYVSYLNFRKKLGEDVDKVFFYSLLMSFLSNDGSTLINYLNTLGFDMPLNNQLKNKKQAYLLSRYVSYLKNYDSNNKDETSKNPLQPEAAEERAQIREVLNQDFIESEGVSRVKEGRDFYWFVQRNGISMKFDLNTHQLKEIVVQTRQVNMKIECFNYVLSGKLQLPELIRFTDTKGIKHSISFTKTSFFAEDAKSFYKRYSKLGEVLDKNSIESVQQKNQLL